MKPAIAARLNLIRLPNVMTAAADSVAGFLFAGGPAADWPTMLLQASASACLYAGGAALNDMCDVAEDARDRPTRPIPSGRVTRREAAGIAIVAMLLGLGLAMAASPRVALTAVPLVGAIVAYDTSLKPTWAGPAVMGLCRALNLGMGIVAATSRPLPEHALAMFLMWFYVQSLAYFARYEVQGGTRAPLTLGTAGVCMGMAGVASLSAVLPQPHLGGLLWIAPATAAVGLAGIAAVMRPGPRQVQQAVKVFVLGVVGFDVGLVWLSRGWEYAGIVAVPFVAAVVLGRFLRMA